MATKSVTDNKTATVFIDGEAGTTGLQIRERLAAFDGVTVRSIDPDRRKDNDARRDLMAEVDLVILCLPDDAARTAVSLADSLGDKAPKIVDASTAHRVSDNWTYGFAELTSAQADAIRQATRVANPGCYPTGAIALLRPLIDAGLLPNDYPITVNAVSGYSGGGKSMIAAYDAGEAPPFEIYGLKLDHKHLPELKRYSGLTIDPIFVPSVGNFAQGMLVSIPLHLASLPDKPTPADIEDALARHYEQADRVTICKAGADDAIGRGRIDPIALNDSDKMELRVFGNDTTHQAVLVARLDNLGKGAAGAAVQNMSLMLGL